MTWIAPEVDRTGWFVDDTERATLEWTLAFQRATLLDKCAGLTGEQLAARPLPPTALSLLGLVRHMATVEQIWFRRALGVRLPPLDRTPGHDPDFDDVDAAHAERDYHRLLAERAAGDAVAAERSLDDRGVWRDTEYSLRMIHQHVIAEYARHNGHADLLREHLDGRTGF